MTGEPQPSPRARRRQGLRVIAVAAEEIGRDRVDYRRSFLQILVRLLPHGAFVRTRTTLYRLAGIDIGAGSAVLGYLRIWGRQPLVVGASTTFSPPCAICLDGPVTIGDDVLIGHDVIIATGAHDVGPSRHRGGSLRGLPTVIGNGVWIGAAALILPGVSIGDGAVVAGGAVVTRDVPPNTIVAGVPARAVRELGG